MGYTVREIIFIFSFYPPIRKKYSEEVGTHKLSQGLNDNETEMEKHKVTMTGDREAEVLDTGSCAVCTHADRLREGVTLEFQIHV